MHFWMIQRAKKEVFGHFRDFGLLDRLGIAYCDGIKCFSGFGNLTRSWRIIQKSLKYILNDPKRQKGGFWPFSGILDYVMAFFHLLEMLTLFAAEYESAKKFIKFNEIIETASLTDLHCRFNKLNRCSRSIRLNVFQHLTPLPGHEGWFKNHKIHFTWFNRFNKFDWFNDRFNGYWLTLRQQVSCITVVDATQVSYRFFWKTALRIS